MKPKLVKRHRNGIFFARPYLGINKITGKPMRPYKRFPEAKTEAEAERMAKHWLEMQMNAAKYGVSGKVAELLENYIDMLEANGQPINTVKTYGSILRSHIAPNVGNMRIEDFTAPTVQSLYQIVLMQESKRGGTISPNTVLKMHWFLSGAFKYLHSNGLCSHNPMASISHPKPSPSKAKAYDESDFSTLVSALDDMLTLDADTPESAFARTVAFASYISLWHGTRAGETCAAARSDVQLWRSNLHVHCTMVEPKGTVERQEKTKGKKSRNLAISGECVDMIRTQFDWIDGRGVKAPSGKLLMACPMPDGSYMRPSDLSRAFKDLIRDRNGLPSDTTFHTLRHTHATWLILNGADIITVKERLGHAKESTTLEVYGHLMPGRDAAAIAAFEQFVASLPKTGGVS